MPDPNRCPDCGHLNPPENQYCEQCNFPLADPAHAPADPAAAPPPPGAPGTDPLVRPFRPIRPRPPRVQQPLQMQLWLVFGSLAALLAGYTAIRGFHESNVKPIEGAQVEQQHRADEARAALAKDSTNLEARIALADVLYDTGNWSEAIVHYRSAARQDSDRVTTIVDLGVCYYNLSQPGRAKELFELALRKDPHQPVALFNMGIVAEREERWDDALQFYHRAVQSGPPESMRQPLMEAMQRCQAKTGAKAPPLQ